MEWASENGEQRPSLNQLAIAKASIEDPASFMQYVILSGLHVIAEEPEFYILDGPTDSIVDFRHYWFESPDDIHFPPIDGGVEFL